MLKMLKSPFFIAASAVVLTTAVVMYVATTWGNWQNRTEVEAVIPEELPTFSVVDYKAFHGPAKPVNLVEYKGKVEHIFFHPLIAYPELAFDGDYQSDGLDDWFCTVIEFKRVLQSLYERDFILVDLNLAFEVYEEDGKELVRQRTLMLPEGKKPIGISIDDLNYYEYMIQNGTVHKLVLDEKGDVVTYTKMPDGSDFYSDDNEIIPILDNFIKANPDFSHEGAKGTIGLTGFAGVLGYRTHSESENREEEIEAVRPVVERLKETGWNFASHSYAHFDAARATYDRLKVDTHKWIDEVTPIVGKTQIHIYPYGSGVTTKDPKYNMFLDAGFKMLCHVGSSSYYVYHPQAVIMDRRHIDGISLRQQRNLNLDIYDADEIIDLVNRPDRPIKR